MKREDIAAEFKRMMEQRRTADEALRDQFLRAKPVLPSPAGEPERLLSIDEIVTGRRRRPREPKP